MHRGKWPCFGMKLGHLPPIVSSSLVAPRLCLSGVCPKWLSHFPMCRDAGHLGCFSYAASRLPCSTGSTDLAYQTVTVVPRINLPEWFLIGLSKMVPAQMKAVALAPSQAWEHRTVGIHWERLRISCQLQVWRLNLWELPAGQRDLRDGYLPLWMICQ